MLGDLWMGMFAHEWLRFLTNRAVAESSAFGTTANHADVFRETHARKYLPPIE
jgi:hypothetical protein